MKKWLLGILAAIGSILAIVLGVCKNKRVKEIKSKIKDNENKVKAIDKEILSLAGVSAKGRISGCGMDMLFHAQYK